MVKGFLVIFLIITTTSILCKAQKSEVYFIPTLHSLHKSNLKYNYDSLRRIVSVLKPDIIAVEIRPEDIGHDSLYLAANYPYEMRMMRTWFPDIVIAGFDWLGEDIAGKKIPQRYWKDSAPIKRFERELDADTLVSAKTAQCDSFSMRRINILKNSTLYELLESEDTQLTIGFYECLAVQLKGSIHERVLRFYDLRNEMILKNIKSLIARNTGKRIVILTGDDHYVSLKSRFVHQSFFQNSETN